MPLTPAEQEELNRLETEVDQNELRRLEAEVAGIERGSSVLNPQTSFSEEPGKYLKEAAEGFGAGGLDMLSFGKLPNPEAQKKAPFAHMAGGATALGLGGAALRTIPAAASALSTIPGIIGEGALMGGAQEFVRSGGDAGSTAKGLALGGVIPAGLGAAGKGYSAFKQAVPKARNIFGLKSIGGTASQMGKEMTHGDPTRMIDRLIQEKIITPLSSQEDIYQALANAEKNAGRNIGNFLDDAQQAKQAYDVPVRQPVLSSTEKNLFGSGYPAGKEPINLPSGGKRDLDYLNSLLDEAVQKNRRLAPSMPRVKEDVRVMSETDGLEKPFSFRKMNEIKGGLGEKGYSLRRQDDLPGHQAYQKGERAIRNIIDADVSALEELGALAPGALKNFRNMNSRFSDLTKARQMAAGEVGRDAKRMSQGLVDTGMGAAGAVVGGVSGGAMGSIPGYMMGVAASKAGRNYGNQVATIGLDKINKLLNSGVFSPKYTRILSAARSRGLNDLAIANYVLSDTDPEFRKEMENAQKRLEQEEKLR